LNKRVFFESEPVGFTAAWAVMMQHPNAGSSSWTDAYLAAFSQLHDYEMVTFVRGFQRWDGLSLSLLI